MRRSIATSRMRVRFSSRSGMRERPSSEFSSPVSAATSAGPASIDRSYGLGGGDGVLGAGADRQDEIGGARRRPGLVVDDRECQCPGSPRLLRRG